MSSGHSVHADIECDLFAFDGGTNRVAQVDLGGFLIWTGEDGTELTFALDFGQLLYVFHVLFVRFCVPKDDTELDSVRFLECEDQCAVGKVAPFVIWPD